MPMGIVEEPFLSAEERSVVNDAKWFASLSPILRHEILRLARVLGFDDGEAICSQGDLAGSWMCCVSGTVRISFVAANGREFTLTYVGPGAWFGDVDMFDGGTRMHNVHARGKTRALFVSEPDLRSIGARHPNFYEAMMWLHARHIRQLYSALAEVQTLGLRARIAKNVLNLARRHGVGDTVDGAGTPLTLRLAQAELSQLIGCSRQRANLELKQMERAGAIGFGTLGLLVRDMDLLAKFAAGA